MTKKKMLLLIMEAKAYFVAAVRANEVDDANHPHRLVANHHTSTLIIFY